MDFNGLTGTCPSRFRAKRLPFLFVWRARLYGDGLVKQYTPLPTHSKRSQRRWGDETVHTLAHALNSTPLAHALKEESEDALLRGVRGCHVRVFTGGDVGAKVAGTPC